MASILCNRILQANTIGEYIFFIELLYAPRLLLTFTVPRRTVIRLKEDTSKYK